MEILPIGTKLIAKTEAKMNDGSGNALTIGKEYEVNFYSANTEEIVIKSDLFSEHFFSINIEDGSYWGLFFDVKSDNI